VRSQTYNRAPQLEPEQLPSTGTERQLIYTLNPAFALVGLPKIISAARAAPSAVRSGRAPTNMWTI
jgi:hypothetical protein